MESPRSSLSQVCSAEFPRTVTRPLPAMATVVWREDSWSRDCSTAQSCSTTAISTSRRGRRDDFALVENGNAVFSGVGDVAERGIAARADAAREIGGPAQAQVAHHLMIGLRGAPVGCQIVPDHRAVRAGKENPALHVAQDLLAPAGHL